MDSPKPDLVNFKKKCTIFALHCNQILPKCEPICLDVEGPSDLSDDEGPKKPKKKVTQVMTQKKFIKGMMGACFINQLRT